MTLSWTAPAANGGSAITDYVVEYTTDTEWTTFTDGISTVTSATVTGLTNGVTYTFRVSARNAVGTGAASGSVSAVPWLVLVPGVPRELTITGVTALTVSLQWRVPATDGGGVITGYVVEQSGDGGSTWFTSLVTGKIGRASCRERV